MKWKKDSQRKDEHKQAAEPRRENDGMELTDDMLEGVSGGVQCFQTLMGKKPRHV